MKKLLIITLGIVLILFSCKEDEVVQVQSLNFAKNKMSLTINHTLQLEVDILPTDADNKTITWASSDEKIAMVDVSGLLTAKTIGDVTITATSNNGKTAKFNLTVSPIEYAMPYLTKDYKAAIDSMRKISATFNSESGDDRCIIILTPKKQEVNMFSYIKYEYELENFNFKALKFSYKIDESLSLPDDTKIRLDEYLYNKTLN